MSTAALIKVSGEKTFEINLSHDGYPSIRDEHKSDVTHSIISSVKSLFELGYTIEMAEKLKDDPAPYFVIESESGLTPEGEEKFVKDLAELRSLGYIPVFSD